MDTQILRPVEEPKKKEVVVVLIVYVVLMILGVGTGYLLSSKKGNVSRGTGTPITTNKVVGVQDASTFKDCATGKLEKDGVEGEGTHKLIREGGPSQTAYLISSVIDLDQYVGKNVNVCGETFAAKKVSWLMDVGRLEMQ